MYLQCPEIVNRASMYIYAAKLHLEKCVGLSRNNYIGAGGAAGCRRAVVGRRRRRAKSI